MSNEEPGPTHTPYGQSSGQPDPYGQQPYGQQYGQQYGQPQSSQQYGYGRPAADRRPGTVTAAAWIAIAFSAIVAAIFGFTTLGLVVARDEVIREMERVPEFQDANIDPDAAVGVLVAVMLGFVVWCLVAIVLAVLVLRRSNVARILLVISAAVTALLSLLTITSGITAVTLVAAIVTIAMLFVGGAGNWFKRIPADGGYGAHPGASYGAPTDSPYGQSQPGQDSAPQYPPPSQNPYGQPPAQPPAQGSSGDGSDDGRSDYPPRDYPGR